MGGCVCEVFLSCDWILLCFAKTYGDGGKLFAKFKENQWGIVRDVDILYKVEWYKSKVGTTDRLSDMLKKGIKNTSKTSLGSDRLLNEFKGKSLLRAAVEAGKGITDADFSRYNRAIHGRRLIDRLIRESIRCQES